MNILNKVSGDEDRLFPYVCLSRWCAAEADVIREGMTPQVAADKALNRIGATLAKYPIAEG